MSDRGRVEQVMCGKAYVVSSVNDRPPEYLEDFVGSTVVSVTAVSDERVVTFHGPGRQDGSCVVVYEKDQGGLGKDVRLWRIAIENGVFEAVEPALVRGLARWGEATAQNQPFRADRFEPRSCPR